MLLRWLTLAALLGIAVALSGCSFLTYGQGTKKPRTEQDYTSRTLRELSTLLPASFATALKEKPDNKTVDLIIHGDLLASRVKVVFEGSTRPLHDKKKNVIRNWAKEFAGAPDFYIRPYQTEALFTENGENHWLAVRTESLSDFEKDFKKGDAVELFLIKFGNVRLETGDEKLAPVILVEKYVKQ